MFHHPKTRVTIRRADAGFFERAEHVNFTRQFRRLRLDGRRAFDGDKVNHLGQIKMVEAMNERAQIRRHRTIGRQFVQHFGLHFYELNDGIAAKPAPVEHERRIVGGGRVHRHRHLIPAGDHLTPMTQPHQIVHALHGFILGLQPAVPVQTRVVVEGGLGKVATQSVVNLPGNQLGMLTERLRHVFHDALGIIPECFAVETDGAARATMFNAAMFVERKNFRMLFGEPDRRRGRGRGQHDLNARFAENIHHPLEPVEIEFTFLRFAKSPGEFAETYNIDARLDHEFGVMLPRSLGVFVGAAVWEDPLFGMIINAKIHMVIIWAETNYKSKSPRLQSKSPTRREFYSCLFAPQTADALFDFVHALDCGFAGGCGGAGDCLDRGRGDGAQDGMGQIGGRKAVAALAQIGEVDVRQWQRHFLAANAPANARETGVDFGTGDEKVVHFNFLAGPAGGAGG